METTPPPATLKAVEFKPPTSEEIHADAVKAVSLTSAAGIIFHSIKVDSDGATHQEFDGTANFLKHVGREISEGSGTPTRLFFFYGMRVVFSTPQVIVGLTAAGKQKPVPVFLARGRDNPGGEVPSGVLDGS